MRTTGNSLLAGAALVAAGLGAAPSQAATVALVPTQDAAVKFGFSGRNDTSGIIQNNAGNRWRVYIQFTLPTGYAGNITDASLELVVSKSVTRNLDLALLTNEVIDVWDEGTINFANAPGTVNADVDQNYSSSSYVLSDTVLLVDNETVSEAVDAVHEFDLSLSLAHLNVDTDDTLTFIISGTQGSTSQPSFYLSEILGKEPVLNLTAVPEPASLALLLGGVAIISSRRRRL